MANQFTVALTGHRPDGLGLGFDPNDWMPAVAQLQLGHFTTWATTYDTLYVISGMALGWDMIGAAAALLAQDSGLDVRLITAIPFEGQQARWLKKRQRQWYERLRERAYREIIVSTGGYHPDKMEKRNQWMMDAALRAGGLCLACYNGSPKGGTANAVRYANTIGLGILNVWPEFFGDRVQQDPPPRAAAAKRAA